MNELILTLSQRTLFFYKMALLSLSLPHVHLYIYTYIHCPPVHLAVSVNELLGVKGLQGVAHAVCPHPGQQWSLYSSGRLSLDTQICCGLVHGNPRSSKCVCIAGKKVVSMPAILEGVFF